MKADLYNRLVAMFEQINVRGQIYRIMNVYKTEDNWYHGQTRTHYRLGDTWTETGYLYRFRMHIREALSHVDETKLNRAIRKYGPQAFIVELLEECEPSIEVLDAKEIWYINEFDTYHSGYNSTPGGHTRAITDDIKLKIALTLSEAADTNRHSQLSDKTVICAGMRKTERFECGRVEVFLDITIANSVDKLVLKFSSYQQSSMELLIRTLRFINQYLPNDKIHISGSLITYVEHPEQYLSTRHYRKMMLSHRNTFK